MSKVQLYVYDLSRGMAKQMSLALTGKQIDGIWHTSVVVFGREIFYGQGILEAKPGTTHHGQPVQIIDSGETQIDQATFEEYLESLASVYTAEAYHLMEHNCNNFTSDVVGFLTGNTTPSWITGLPAEFLATPFGQMLKPQIDSMFRSRSSNEHRVNPHAGPSVPTPSRTPQPGNPRINPLLDYVASAATSSNPSASAAPSSPLLIVSSMKNFDSIMNQPALIVNFTNTAGCPPCRMIQPIFEGLATDYAATHTDKGLRFVEVELDIGQGREIAGRFGVSATPTFMFFRDGKKVDQMNGANKRDLETKVEDFILGIWPLHLHRKVYLPTIEGLPITAITNTTVPNYVALLGKLDGLLEGRGAAASDILKSKVVPLLEGQGDGSVVAAWNQATIALLDILEPEQTFPLIDLWRVGVLKPVVFTRLIPSPDPIPRIIQTASSLLLARGVDTPKPFLLTILRLLTNITSSLPLTNVLHATHSALIISIAVEALLHADQSVRSAAAGLAINLANYRHRQAKHANTKPEEAELEWESELLTAVIEAIGREEDEDVAHRLVVVVAHLVWLNSGLEGMREMIYVLEAKQTIEKRMAGWKKKELKKLGEELISKVL